jgi:hypothetical protein
MTNMQKLKDSIEQAEKNIAKAAEGLEGSQEQQVVTLKDFKQWEQIMQEYRCGDVFFCPKCDSSIICLCDQYKNNNIMNSMNPEDSTPYSNQDFKKIVLECGNCKYRDILIKFLKPFERKSIIDPEGLVYPLSKPRRQRYYSPLLSNTSNAL